METISNQTMTTCQHCGKWTNYAGDTHHKAREDRIEKLEVLLQALEWHGGASYVCPCCFKAKEDGHANCCMLAAMLNSKDGKDGTRWQPQAK